MVKRLISITDRQDMVFKGLSEELEVSFSELFRRALDTFIEEQIKKGTLIRFEFSDVLSGKSITLESPKKAFKSLYDYAKANPNGALKLR